MKIYINGEISIESFSEFSKELDSVKGNQRVEIELTSDGGDAQAALAFYEKIKRHPGDVTITTYGIVASAAVLVLAAGDVRRMSKESWMMVHEDQLDLENLSVSQAEKITKHHRRMEEQWCEILSNVSSTHKGAWENLHKKETWLSAEECLKLGIIEQVI